MHFSSAQLKLQESHVVLFDNQNLLCDEIVKNLAMSGVGKLTIVLNSSSKRTVSGLRGNSSLANYAKELNPLVQVLNLFLLMCF